VPWLFIFLAIRAQAAPADDLADRVAALVRKHHVKAGEAEKTAYTSRVLAAVRPCATDPESLERVLDVVDGQLRSAVVVADFHNRALGYEAPPTPGATRELPPRLFLESYALSIDLVEATLAEHREARPPSPTGRETLRAQIAELVNTWKTAASGLLTGEHAQKVIDTLAVQKRMQLESQIGIPFVGLTAPLDGGQMASAKESLWKELSELKERPSVDDPRLAALFRNQEPQDLLRTYGELPPDLKARADALRDFTDKLGNAVHVIWNYSHPRAAPVLMKQEALNKEIEDFVTQTQRREGTAQDPLTEDPKRPAAPPQPAIPRAPVVRPPIDEHPSPSTAPAPDVLPRPVRAPQSSFSSGRLWLVVAAGAALAWIVYRALRR
jgi:hypothetical protein